LSPLEEGVALAIALEFEGSVEGVGVAGAVFVDLDGMIDDQLSGLERVDLLWIATEELHRIAHGGEVDHGGTPVKSCMRTRRASRKFRGRARL